MPTKIFGTNPTLWIAILSQAVVLIGTLGFGWISGDQAALVVVAINAIAGVINALTVRPISPTVFTYAAGSLFTLATAYGMEFTPDQVAAVNGLVIVVLGLLSRNQQSPIETAVTNTTEAPVPEAVPSGGFAEDAIVDEGAGA